MRVGLVRNVGLSAVALLALGLAGCDDNPLEFEDGVGVLITTNPSTMIIPADITTLLETRVVDEGSRPTFDDITWALDATCGAATLTIAEAATFEPEVQPPVVLDITGGLTLGTTCITLTGGGVTASVGVTVVGDSLDITGTPAMLVVFESLQLGAVLRSDLGNAVGPFDPTTDLVWSSDATSIASVDQTGFVTTGPLGGTATITAVWSNAGVSVSAEGSVEVDIPNPVLASADLTNAVGGQLVTLTGTGLIVGAHLIFADGVELDAATLPTIVDATTATFLMPLGAAGPVDFTIGSDCCGESNAISVIRDDIPAPVLISTDVGNADAGDLITITGTGIFTGNAVVPEHVVFVDGVAMTDPLVVSTVLGTTTATFGMPPGAPGNVDVQMGDLIVGLSNILVVVRDTDDLEPNETFGTAPALPAFPVVIDNWMDGAVGDVDDFWMWSPGASVTLDLGMSWVGSSGDLDLLFHTAQPPGNYNACFALATGNVPEAGQCTFAAGTYVVRVNAYDGATGLTRYTLTMTVVP